MTRYIVSRLLIVVVSLLGLVTLSFALVSIIPGDPARVMLGDYATKANIAEVHHQLGLDRPFTTRYVDYVAHTLQGDLGTSYFTKTPVGHDLAVRLPTTLILLLPGLALALVLGLAMGSLAAYFRGRGPDRVVRLSITTLQAIPEFVIGLLLLYVLFFTLGLAPAPVGMLSAADVVPRAVTGSVPLDAVLTGAWSTVGAIAGHAMLPILTIGIFFAAYFAKTVRGGMATALASRQVEFARACGLPERKVFWYALTSVRTSLLTYVALLFGAALGGAAIVEVLFAWPGVGNWSLQGVLKGDIPVIQGFVFMMGVATLLVYLALDVLVMLLDPRARKF